MLLTLTISLVRENRSLWYICDWVSTLVVLVQTVLPSNVLVINAFSFNLLCACVLSGSYTCFVTMAGYGKMPEYEHIFTDFLLSLAESNYKRLSGSNG